VDARELGSVDVQSASPDFFRLLRLPIERGRGFQEQDGPAAGAVAVVSASLARQFWPGEEPVGQRIQLGSEADPRAAWLTIVGVAADVKQNWWDAPARALVYRPLAQVPPPRRVHFLLRAGADPGSLAAAARQRLSRLDPGVSYGDVGGLDRFMAGPMSLLR